MKILVFYQYFSTPRGSWGTRIYEFAKYWIEAGHEVEVVTSIYAKSDLNATKFIEYQLHSGIKVTVINIRVDNKQSILRRIWSFLQYTIVSSYFALVRNPDVTIASSGPITVGLPGLISKYFRKSILVFEVRDLWPEGAIELGLLRNKFLIIMAKRFEKLIYNSAKLIVCLSPGMRNHIRQKCKHTNIISITNSANLELFSSNPRKRIKDKIFDNKYAIYTGNIGDVNNSYWLLNACRELKKLQREDIRILLIGEGQQREELCELAVKENLKAFEYRSLMPKTELAHYIQFSIAALVPLKGTPILDTSSPNKFFESLAAGVPVIQNTNGWMKDYLEKNKVGITLSPDDARALANTLIELADNSELQRSLSVNARFSSRRDFNQSVLSMKYLQSMERL